MSHIDFTFKHFCYAGITILLLLVGCASPPGQSTTSLASTTQTPLPSTSDQPSPSLQPTSPPQPEPTNEAAAIHTQLPSQIDPEERYPFYLHGRIIED